MDPVETIVET